MQVRVLLRSLLDLYQLQIWKGGVSLCQQKNKDMNAQTLIRYIAEHPEFTNIVIQDQDDMTPIEAISYLTSLDQSHVFRINGSLEKNTLLVW